MGFRLLNFLFLRLVPPINIKRITQNLFHLGVVHHSFILIQTQLRNDLNLSLIYLKFISHDEQKGQRRDQPSLSWVVGFELLEVGLGLPFLYVVAFKVEGYGLDGCKTVFVLFFLYIPDEKMCVDVGDGSLLFFGLHPVMHFLAPDFNRHLDILVTML